MSIDRYIWVPADTRHDRNLSFTIYHRLAALEAAHCVTGNQVFLAHGGPNLFDEQYFFEDPADAQWFWDGGYKERLFHGEDFGYDRMRLWLDD